LQHITLVVAVVELHLHQPPGAVAWAAVVTGQAQEQVVLDLRTPEEELVVQETLLLEQMEAQES
jgi:hypothetical protein